MDLLIIWAEIPKPKNGSRDFGSWSPLIFLLHHCYIKGTFGRNISIKVHCCCRQFSPRGWLFSERLRGRFQISRVARAKHSKSRMRNHPLGDNLFSGVWRCCQRVGPHLLNCQKSTSEKDNTGVNKLRFCRLLIQEVPAQHTQFAKVLWAGPSPLRSGKRC